MDDKIYTNEVIENNPFPNQEVLTTAQTPSAEKDTFSNTVIKPPQFPTKRIAQELIGSSLNTRSRKILAEFEFTQSGALQIGKYTEGVTGDIRISPNGIVGRDSSGLTTFAIDATTGDVVFKGSVQAGSVITGVLYVGNNSIVIDGDTRRMVFYDENDVPVILIGNA